jgi:hypothetical protein
MVIADTNSVVGMAFNTLVDVSGGGNWIFIGILLFAVIGWWLMKSGARASTVVMVGVSLATIMIYAVVPEFQFIFWIAIIAAMFVLINGLRKWITGQ